MKKIFALAALMISAFNGFSQENTTVNFTYAVKYDYSFQPSKTDKETRVAEDMYLQTGPDYSYFLSYIQHRADSIMEVFSNIAEQENRIPPTFRASDIPRAKIQYKVYRDFSEKQMYFLATFALQKAHYKEPMLTFTWNLQDEEKEIAGYTCKKATTSYAGRDYIAWYATTIPIADGPFKFGGLPGLILSIYDTENEYVFTAKEVQKRDITTQLKKWEGRLVHGFSNRRDYQEFTKKLKDDPSLMLQQDLIPMPEEAKKNAIEKIKADIAKNDNPLERMQN